MFGEQSGAAVLVDSADAAAAEDVVGALPGAVRAAIGVELERLARGRAVETAPEGVEPASDEQRQAETDRRAESLEQRGLLTQPHTSAGRIPSQQGYRLYVDELLPFKLRGYLEYQEKRTAWTDLKVIAATAAALVGWPVPLVQGAVWFLPAAPDAGPLDSLFLVDGTGDVEFDGICLNSRDGGARSGIRLRCGIRIQIRGCRFGDFRDPDGAALLLDGESEDRCIREIVIQDCRFVHGAVGIRLGRFATDLLVADNRFEEFSGPATVVDPRDAWTDYSLIYVKNRLLCRTHGGAEPFLRIGMNRLQREMLMGGTDEQ